MPPAVRAKLSAAAHARDAAKTTKQCPRCKQVLPIETFEKRSNGRQRKPYCPPCQIEHGREASARWARENPEKAHETQRRNDLRIRYGISPEGYDDLLKAQEGRCATCGTDKPGRADARYFCVDHNHETGGVRGLLCAQCNTAIGTAKDSPELLRAMAVYLEFYRHPLVMAV